MNNERMELFSVNTQKSVSQAIKEYTDFIIYYALYGEGFVGIQTLIDEEAESCDIFFRPELVAKLKESPRKAVYSLATCSLSLKPMSITKNHAYAQAIDEPVDLSEVEIPRAQRCLFDRSERTIESRMKLVDMLWNLRISFLSEPEINSDVYGTDILLHRTDEHYIKKTLEQELLLWRRFACERTSPRASIYGALDVQSFSDSTLRCMKMYLEQFVPVKFLEAFSSSAMKRDKLSLHKEIARWDEEYGTGLMCKFALPCPADMYEYFLLFLISKGDDESLMTAFSAMVICNLLCRIEVPNHMTFEQFMIPGFEPARLGTNKDSYYFTINSSQEKTSKMRNYTRAVYLNGNKAELNIFLPLALLFCKFKDQITGLELTVKLRKFFQISAFSAMFKKKLREFYEESWGFSLEEERSGYESSFQYCTMTWGDISLFTGYTLRKMAVDFCMESFLNISENIVRARGRWFQSIAALVSEIKQYKDSFRKYNLITSSAQDHQIGRHLGGKYCKDFRPHYVLAFLDDKFGRDKRWSAFLPDLGPSYGHYSKLLRVSLAQAILQLPNHVFQQNWHLHQLKTAFDDIYKLRKNNECGNILMKPKRPVAGETHESCLLDLGITRFLYVDGKIISRKYTPQDSLVFDFTDLTPSAETSENIREKTKAFLADIGMTVADSFAFHNEEEAAKRYVRTLELDANFMKNAQRCFQLVKNGYGIGLRNIYYLMYNATSAAARIFQSSTSRQQTQENKRRKKWRSENVYATLKNQLQIISRYYQVVMAISPSAHENELDVKKLQSDLEKYMLDTNWTGSCTIRKLYNSLRSANRLQSLTELGFVKAADTMAWLNDTEEDEDNSEQVNAAIRAITKVKAVHWFTMHEHPTVNSNMNKQQLHKLLREVYSEIKHNKESSRSFLRELTSLNKAKGRGVKTVVEQMQKDRVCFDLFKS